MLAAAARRGGKYQAATRAQLAYLAMARIETREREILVLGAMRPVLSAADIPGLLGMDRAAAGDLSRHAVRRLREEAARLGFPPGTAAAELIGAMSGRLLGRVPRDRVMYMCLNPDLAGRRRQVQDRAGPFKSDGFPVRGACAPEPVTAARRRRVPGRHRLTPPGGGPRLLNGNLTSWSEGHRAYASPQ